MKLKRRFIISNTITIVIPLIITLIVGICFVFISSMFLHKTVTYNNFKQLTLIKAELLGESSNISELSGDEVLRDEFNQYLMQRMNALQGEFIITKNDKVSVASKGINKIDIERTLELLKTNGFQSSITVNNKSYFVQETGLMLQDGIKVNIILLAPFGDKLDVIPLFLIILLVVFILSFAAVNLFMSYLFTKGITKPIEGLKTAADEISSGNLQCEIIEDGDDEIKELCNKFEVMRVQLKDSINMKTKYDDNRNMLISSISHDLRTPITSIKGYVEGILDGVTNTPEKLEMYLRTIYSKTEHIDSMIDDLLLYSRLELNQLPYNYEDTDILEYIKFCISEVTPEFERSNIRLEVISEFDEVRYVKLDRDRMRRVIVNIVDNSRKYMNKEQGQITVMLRETKLSIIIEFKDNGSGIEKDDVNKVFDRFYRSDAARSEAEGSGLGLAIAKQIVEGHKGKIWALGHEGEGTSILISLAKIIGGQSELYEKDFNC